MNKSLFFYIIVVFFTCVLKARAVTDFVINSNDLIKTTIKDSTNIKLLSYLSNKRIISKENTTITAHKYLDIDCQSYEQTINPPLEIGPDAGSETYTTISVSENLSITDINVLINLNHTFDPDLEISLTAPDGTTTIDLSSGNGGYGSGNDNYTNTLFDDDATQSIIDGTAPFTGSYQPEEALSTFNTLASLGDWTLIITDNTNGDGGELLNWSLEVCGTIISDIDCYTHALTIDPPLEIGPDAGSEIYATISVSENLSITDINILINLNHTFDPDLEISLTAPDGTTTINLSSGNGGYGSGNDNYTNTLFDDDAAQSIIDGTAPFTGSYQPEEALSTFNTLASLGDWTLRITDNTDGDGGELLNWSIEVCGTSILGTNDVFVDNLVQLYPNPTNGIVHLNNQESITLSVFDILGKQVYTNSYQVGLNQIDLTQYISGVYFVRVELENNLQQAVKTYKIIKR